MQQNPKPSRLRENVQRGGRFLFEDIWRLDETQPQGAYGVFLTVLRFSILAGKQVAEKRVLLHAASLAYTTLFSIVPLLAVVLIGLKAFGQYGYAEKHVWPFIRDSFAAGTGDTLTEALQGFIDKIQGGAVGGIGMFTLIWMVISLLGSIENAFNDIWGITRKRTLVRKFTSYWSVVTLGPIFVFASIAMTASFRSSYAMELLTGLPFVGRAILRILPLTMVWLAFALIYAYMPNTRVHLKSAIIGGIVAGTLWDVGKYGYILYAAKSAKATMYWKIYGTLAAIPIFLFWVYLSWLIVLFGATLSCVSQNLAAFASAQVRHRAAHTLKQLVALRITVAIAEAFHAGRSALSANGLAASLHLPMKLVEEALADLLAGGILVEVTHQQDDLGYHPARSMEGIKVKHVLDTMAQAGEKGQAVKGDAMREYLESLLGKVDTATEGALEGLTLRDVVLKARG